MSGFEHYPQETRALELALERMGVALGIDWLDDAQVRALAHEALSDECKRTMAAAAKGERAALARADLFGLAALMVKTLQESADEGVASSGGPAWRSFSGALLAELDAGGPL
ncbi:MAG: hypothetical protein IPJ21_00390 [Sterolibacteriaceae bacterium]|jgi:hypothetical protein|nr:hypothetical protein [Sterolibacteriaceae bacterium]MBK9086118.1 hypothetical protein [Sterolibacteriaceae bacterium]